MAFRRQGRARSVPPGKMIVPVVLSRFVETPSPGPQSKFAGDSSPLNFTKLQFRPDESAHQRRVRRS